MFRGNLRQTHSNACSYDKITTTHKIFEANTIPEFSTLSPLISEIIYAFPTDSRIYDVFPDDSSISRSYS